MSRSQVAALYQDKDDYNFLTDLYSHFITGCGKVLYGTGGNVKIVSFKGFTDDILNSTMVSVIKTAVLYDCEYYGYRYILIIINDLHINSILVNLILCLLCVFQG